MRCARRIDNREIINKYRRLIALLPATHVLIERQQRLLYNQRAHRHARRNQQNIAALAAINARCANAKNVDAILSKCGGATARACNGVSVRSRHAFSAWRESA